LEVLKLLETLQREIGRVDMCFGGKKVKTADEFYQEKKKDYGPLPSLSMGDSAQQTQSMTDVKLPKMRSSGMAARSLLKMGSQY